jgi:hypothetical protein
MPFGVEMLHFVAVAGTAFGYHTVARAYAWTPEIGKHLTVWDMCVGGSFTAYRTLDVSSDLFLAWKILQQVCFACYSVMQTQPCTASSSVCFTALMLGHACLCERPTPSL